MSIQIQTPTASTPVTVCPVVVTVQYNATIYPATLPAGWYVRCTISDSTAAFTKTPPDVSLQGKPPTGTATVTFDGANAIPNGSRYQVDADLLMPDPNNPGMSKVHSSALPVSPVTVNC